MAMHTAQAADSDANTSTMIGGVDRSAEGPRRRGAGGRSTPGSGGSGGGAATHANLIGGFGSSSGGDLATAAMNALSGSALTQTSHDHHDSLRDPSLAEAWGPSPLDAAADVTRESDGATALYVAVEKQYLDTTRALLAAGADPNKVRPEVGVTPIFVSLLRSTRRLRPSYGISNENGSNEDGSRTNCNCTAASS